MFLLLVAGPLPLLHGAAIEFLAPAPNAQVFGPTTVWIKSDLVAIDRVELRVDGKLAGVALGPPFRFVYDFGDGMKPHELTATIHRAGYSLSDSVTMKTSSIALLESASVDLVEIPLSLRSGTLTLEPADIVVEENGVLQRVLELRPGRGPTRFVFLVDRSLSMGTVKLEAAVAAIRSAARQLRSGDTGEVVFFNHRVDPARPLTEALEHVPSPAGGTSLRDAVASIVSKRPTVAIVISDGGDRNSLLDEQSAIRKTSRSNLTLYALNLGNDSMTPFLGVTVERTGGRAIATGSSTISRDLATLFQEINSSYAAVYQSSNHTPGWRTIKVRRARRAIQISTRKRGYFAE